MIWEADFDNSWYTAAGRAANYLVECWGGGIPPGEKVPVWFRASAEDKQTGGDYYFNTQTTSLEAAKRLCEVFDEVAIFPSGAPYVPDGGTWR